MSIPYLDPNSVWFPDPRNALKEPNGLIAAGGSLSTEWLLQAYRQGIFPWYEEGQPILWWSPDPRLILLPGDFRVSKSLRKLARKHVYEISFDKNFSGVLNGCKHGYRKLEGTWITNDIAVAYTNLHLQGIAHSVEVWSSSSLVGGLYGIAIGKVFFGESMFSKVDNASKLALFYLTLHLKEWGFEFIDCQVHSNHLESLGALEIPRCEFMKKLEALTEGKPNNEEWQVDQRINASFNKYYE